MAELDAESEFERAVALHRSGRTTDAEALCRAILATAPGHPRSLHLLGVIRFAAGDTEAGIELLTRALSARPDYADAEFNLGVMVAAGGRLPEALAHFDRVVASRPDHADAHIRRGAMLMGLDRPAEAESAFRRALELRPDDGLILADLSSVAFRQRAFDRAVEYGRRAAARTPESPETHLRLGRALMEQGAYGEARGCFRRALDLDPQSVPATSHLASVLLATGEPDAAIDHYRRAVALAPDDFEPRRRLLAALLYSPNIAPVERFAAHQEFGRAASARVTAGLPPPANDRDPERKLRIGWQSSDLRDHPVARNLEPLFTQRDRARFDMIAYAEVDRPDAGTDWFRAQMDAWRSTVGMSDTDVAGQIRSDHVDIMVYLAGRFDRNRLQIAAWRPAPVQVSLHDPGTSGLLAMDYLIADPVLAPRGAVERFVERVIRVPNFIVQPPISWTGAQNPPPAARRGYITFGSFNNPAKLNRQVLATWAEVLRRVPTARLYLKYRRHFGDVALRDRICRDLGRDVAARVEFDDSDQPMAEHLTHYENVDIALDPFPFTGSTTTFEALWMGVPVVTLVGDGMAGRWSASILTALKLPELIAATAEEYVRIAAELGTAPERLASLRGGLRRLVAASPLCDGRRAMRYFERACRAMWRAYCRGTPVQR